MSAILSLRKQRFIAEYLVDGNAAQAAVRAGYSYKYGHKLMRDPNVRAELNLKAADAMSPQEVLQRISGIARGEGGETPRLQLQALQTLARAMSGDGFAAPEAAQTDLSMEEAGALLLEMADVMEQASKDSGIPEALRIY